RLRHWRRAPAGRPRPPEHARSRGAALRSDGPDARDVPSSSGHGARAAGAAMRSVYVALIRHAPTAWNAGGRVPGRADPPLSPEGAERATRWRLPSDLRVLATRGQLGWAVSPLRRAVETARLLGAVSPVVEPRLAEQDWGEWTGRARGAVAAETIAVG